MKPHAIDPNQLMGDMRTGYRWKTALCLSCGAHIIWSQNGEWAEPLDASTARKNQYGIWVADTHDERCRDSQAWREELEIVEARAEA